MVTWHAGKIFHLFYKCFIFYYNCYFKTKTIEIKRRFSTYVNGRNCNTQYGGIVPSSKWKSQSLIGKVIVSLQHPLEAPVPIETWGWTSQCSQGCQIGWKTKFNFFTKILSTFEFDSNLKGIHSVRGKKSFWLLSWGHKRTHRAKYNQMHVSSK